MSLSKIKIQKTAQSLIGHLDPAAKLTVEDREDVWRISVESETSAMLIGRRGQTLQALEHILRLIVAKEADEFLPLVLDISGYRAAREQEVADMAKTLASEVIENGESRALPPMNSFERRIAHTILTEVRGIEAGSIGEEPYRKIVIKKK